MYSTVNWNWNCCLKFICWRLHLQLYFLSIQWNKDQLHLGKYHMCFACLYPKAGGQGYSVAGWDAFTVESLRRNMPSMYSSPGNCTKMHILAMGSLLRQIKFPVPLLSKASGWDEDSKLENRHICYLQIWTSAFHIPFGAWYIEVNPCPCSEGRNSGRHCMLRLRCCERHFQNSFMLHHNSTGSGPHLDKRRWSLLIYLRNSKLLGTFYLLKKDWFVLF